MNVLKLKLSEIQPSQLYISTDKLKSIRTWLGSGNLECYEPLPVKQLQGKVIYTDGHTRALALYQMGVEEVSVYWDKDDLDWEAYQVCVDWCEAEGITDISHLVDRIVTGEEYELLWHQRCREMQARLAKIRSR